MWQIWDSREILMASVWERKRPPGISRPRNKDNIKINLVLIIWEINWIYLLSDRKRVVGS
jgi:hypothetical protein